MRSKPGALPTVGHPTASRVTRDRVDGKCPGTSGVASFARSGCASAGSCGAETSGRVRLVRAARAVRHATDIRRQGVAIGPRSGLASTRTRPMTTCARRSPCYREQRSDRRGIGASAPSRRPIAEVSDDSHGVIGVGIVPSGACNCWKRGRGNPEEVVESIVARSKTEQQSGLQDRGLRRHWGPHTRRPAGALVACDIRLARSPETCSVSLSCAAQVRTDREIGTYATTHVFMEADGITNPMAAGTASSQDTIV